MLAIFTEINEAQVDIDLFKVLLAVSKKEIDTPLEFLATLTNEYGLVVADKQLTFSIFSEVDLNGLYYDIELFIDNVTTGVILQCDVAAIVIVTQEA